MPSLRKNVGGYLTANSALEGVLINDVRCGGKLHADADIVHEKGECCACMFARYPVVPTSSIARQFFIDKRLAASSLAIASVIGFPSGFY